MSESNGVGASSSYSVPSSKSHNMTDASLPYIEPSPEAMQNRRQSSFSTSGSYRNAYPNCEEIQDTLKTRIQALTPSILAVGANVGILVFMYYLQTKGTGFPMSVSDATNVGVVIVLLTLLLGNWMTRKALDDGMAVLIGSFLASKEGYSLAACGYQQLPSVVEKLRFIYRLSPASPCRNYLLRISSFWIFISCLFILGPLTSIGIKAREPRITSGTVSCLILSDQNEQTDRSWPTMMTQNGVAEVVFGTALGVPRSEFPVNETLVLLTPQIVGVVEDGDTLIGPGYSGKLLTSCTCARSINATSLQSAKVPDIHVSSLMSHWDQLTPGQTGFANAITVKDASAEITSLLMGVPSCSVGGYVCNTTLFDYRKAESILVTYMTDGTPASIAPKKASMIKSGAKSNITWPATALLTILGGTYSHFNLPSTVTGMVNPLLYWTTSNLTAIDPLLLDAGMETLFAILLRSGTQRTYPFQGYQCIRDMHIKGSSILYLDDWWGILAIIAASTQLVIALCSFLFFLPWFLSDCPIAPGIRLTKDKAYFTTLVHASSIFKSHYLSCSSDYEIWRNLDIVVRIGETLKSRDELPVGKISIDHPTQICSLTNGRLYN